jgi:hypothetical protein
MIKCHICLEEFRTAEEYKYHHYPVEFYTGKTESFLEFCKRNLINVPVLVIKK